jgi:hypothetical protein
MKMLFDYPEEGWISLSEKQAVDLAIAIDKALNRMGVKTQLLSATYPSVVGWKVVVQAASFNIKFVETDFGCELHVYIFSHDKDALKFQGLWKLLVDNKLVRKGPYTKSLENDPEHAVQEKISPFVEYAKTVIDDPAMKSAEKTKILILVAVQSFFPKQKLTETKIRNALDTLTTGRIESVLQTNGYFERLIKKVWESGTKNEFPFSVDEVLNGRIEPNNPFNLYRYYRDKNLQEQLEVL